MIKPFRQISRLYSISTNIMDIKTFIFFDLETTGLPHYEFGATKITELSLIAAQADHMRLGVIPRVQNKLCLCFNPRKDMQRRAIEITGLSNKLLEFQEEFSRNTLKLLENFINVQYKPVCFVAHNGNRFDFPIIRTEINRIGCEFLDNIMCVDSLRMFREFYYEDLEKTEITRTNDSDIPVELLDGYDEILCTVLDDMDAAEAMRKENVKKIQIKNETTPKRKDTKCNDTNNALLGDIPNKSNGNKSSRDCDLDIYFNLTPRCEKKPVLSKSIPKKKLFNGVSFALSAVYERVTKKAANNTHQAECDANLLLECAVEYADRFVSYCNYNAMQLTEIPLLKAGKEYGI